MTRAEKIELLKTQAEEAKEDLQDAARAYVNMPDRANEEALEAAAEHHAAVKNLLNAVLNGKRI